jgi:hypothetical protein
LSHASIPIASHQHSQQGHLLHHRYRVGDRPPQPRRNIQTFWLNHCEDEWQKAFFFFSSSRRLIVAKKLAIALLDFPVLPNVHHDWSLRQFRALAGVAVFYVTLTLASWIKFPTIPIAAIIMTVVFGLGFAYFIYIHVRWLGPMAGSSAFQHGHNVKVQLLSFHASRFQNNLTRNG